MLPQIVSSDFTVVDFYQSKMFEYDNQFVFMPIQELQHLRMGTHPSTRVGHAVRHRDQAPAGG